jgi:hypothetical protein
MDHEKPSQWEELLYDYLENNCKIYIYHIVEKIELTSVFIARFVKANTSYICGQIKRQMVSTIQQRPVKSKMEIITI